MGFRSTVSSSEFPGSWPAWFREKYSDYFNFSDASVRLTSAYPLKLYAPDLSELEPDIQKALSEALPQLSIAFVVVYLHECGGITRCMITPTSIKFDEPTAWEQTEDVTHHYCYWCRDS
jgi:hypothetical protein